MKYLKTFEYNLSNKSIYYKIIIDGSFDKFTIALEKLGMLESFLFDWDINDFDDIEVESKYLFSNEYIYLAIAKSEYSNRRYITDFTPTNFIVRRYITDFPDSIQKFEYGGEIKIEDYEIDSKKFNL